MQSKVTTSEAMPSESTLRAAEAMPSKVMPSEPKRSEMMLRKAEAI